MSGDHEEKIEKRSKVREKEIAVIVYGAGENGLDSGTDIHEAVHALGR